MNKKRQVQTLGPRNSLVPFLKLKFPPQRISTILLLILKIINIYDVEKSNSFFKRGEYLGGHTREGRRGSFPSKNIHPHNHGTPPLELALFYLVQ